jgi:hypothetical protein
LIEKEKFEGINTINNLIENDHFQLETMFSLLNSLKRGNELIAFENINTDFSKTETSIKYYCFLTSSLLDLTTTLKGFLITKTKWEIIYYSKYSFLIIYETIKTHHKYQKDFRKILNKYYPNLIDEFNELNYSLKQFKNKFKYDTKIAFLRNNASGHWNNDFSVYYEQISNLTLVDSVKAITEFLDFLKSLIYFIYKFAEETEEITVQNTNNVNAELLEKMKELSELVKKEKNY